MWPHGAQAWCLAILNIFGWILLWYSLIVLAYHSQIGSSHRFKDWGTNLLIALRSKKIIMLISSCALLLVGLFRDTIGDLLPPFPRMIMIGSGALWAIKICMPPSVLFLSASQDKGRTLLRDIQSACIPLKVSHLLTRITPEAQSVNEDQYRVFFNWEAAVENFSAISPLILVDARAITSHVYHEVKKSLQGHLVKKTIYVVDRPGPDSIFYLLLRELEYSDDVLVTTPELICSGMRSMTQAAIRHKINDPINELAGSLYRLRCPIHKFNNPSLD